MNDVELLRQQNAQPQTHAASKLTGYLAPVKLEFYH